MHDIFEAIDNNDLEKVKEIIAKDPAQMNNRNLAGHLPIFYAILAYKDNSLNAPFYHAIYVRKEKIKNDIIEFLLKNTKDINVKSNSGEPLIFAALVLDEPNLLFDLIKRGADINSHNNDVSLVSLALYLKGEALLFKLIDQGADVNLVNKQGSPFIFNDLNLEDKDLLLKLIDRGLNLNLNYDPFIFKALKKYDKDFFFQLIDKGLDLNAKDREGNLFIFKVLELDDKDLLLKLIDKGAELNLKDSKGNSLVFKALELEDGYLLSKLINKGAILDDNDKEKLQSLLPEKAQELIKKSDENKARHEAIAKAKKEYSKDLNSLRLVSKNSEQNYILIDSLPAEANFHIFKQIRPAALTEKEAGQVITKRDRIINERRQQENSKVQISR